MSFSTWSTAFTTWSLFPCVHGYIHIYITQLHFYWMLFDPFGRSLLGFIWELNHRLKLLQLEKAGGTFRNYLIVLCKPHLLQRFSDESTCAHKWYHGGTQGCPILSSLTIFLLPKSRGRQRLIFSKTSQKMHPREPHILCYPSYYTLILPNGQRQLRYTHSRRAGDKKGKMWTMQKRNRLF